jgi:3-methylcrotonyl-CoA carboxylase alpha subunit
MIYQYEGDAYSVNLERRQNGSYTAVIDRGDLPGRSYTLQAQPLKDGGWLLTLDERQIVAHVAVQGDSCFVHVGGQHYTLIVPDARSPRRRSSAGGGDLTAQMPGQVTEVLVGEGDTVERGQTLVILEAMKMEIRVSAPGDGVVKRLLVRAGDVVERGQLLAEIEVKET